jgi:hypothetical protein
MFGPLFSSEKKPKGPDLYRLEELTFDLSGNKLTCSLPFGNCRQSPKPQGNLVPTTNLYDAEQFDKDDGDDWYAIRTILERDFIYSSFNHPRLGKFQLMIMLNKLDNLESNLFNPLDFQEKVKSRTTFYCQQFNDEIDDPFLKIVPENDYQLSRIGDENYLKYTINFQRSPYCHYALAISSEHYITFGFRYYSANSAHKPWYLMARELEQKIMSSVKLELTDSFQQEKEAANG